MKIGLFFGTFNPIHNGHITIAEFMANKTDLAEIWLVVSPQNPLKKNAELLNDKVRFQLVKIAVKNHRKLKASDVEFKLSKPSYTFNTLLFLKNKFPKKKFVLIVGEDNLRNFHQWKNYKKILHEFELYVYPRKIQKNEIKTKISHQNIKRFKVPLLNMSATEIRNKIKVQKNVSYLLPEGVSKVIRHKKYYIERNHI